MLELIGWIVGIGVLARLLQAILTTPEGHRAGGAIFWTIIGMLAVTGLLIALHLCAADIAEKADIQQRSDEIDRIFRHP